MIQCCSHTCHLINLRNCCVERYAKRFLRNFLLKVVLRDHKNFYKCDFIYNKNNSYIYSTYLSGNHVLIKSYKTSSLLLGRKHNDQNCTIFVWRGGNENRRYTTTEIKYGVSGFLPWLCMLRHTLPYATFECVIS